MKIATLIGYVNIESLDRKRGSGHSTQRADPPLYGWNNAETA